MSFVSGLTGLAGGTAGTGLAAPSLAETQNPTTVDQTNVAYDQTQSGIAQQQAFAQQLAAQNGAGNQSAVFNQLQGVADGTGPNPAQAQLAQATGTNVSNQAALMAGQRGSSQNAGMIARQAAMQGANTQQQAAGQAATLQATQSMNALGAMGTLANQQVTNQANANNAYSTAALSQQQNLLNGISGQNNAAVANQASVNTANASLAGGTKSGQSGLLGNLAGAAGPIAGMFKGSSGGGADVGGGLGAIGGGTSEAGGAGDLLGGAGSSGGDLIGGGTMLAAKGGMVPRFAEGGQVDLTGGMQPMMQAPMATDPNAPMGTPGSNMGASGPQSYYGQSLNQGVSTAGPDLGAVNATVPEAKGGAEKLTSDINILEPEQQRTATAEGDGKTAVINGNAKDLAWNWEGTEKGAGEGAQIGGYVGSIFPVVGNVIGAAIGAVVGGVGGGVPEGKRKPVDAKAEGGAIHKGKTDALVSPGEKYLSPEAVQQVLHGKDAMKLGKTVPGTPKVGGAKNSYANDTVPAKLDPGGIVLPRSITQGKHPGFAAKKFVEMTLAKHSLPKKGGK